MVIINGENVRLTVQVTVYCMFSVCSYTHEQIFQLQFVRPLVSSPSPTKVNSMMAVSHMTMMAHHGVILVMVKRTTVRLSVQVTLC